MRFSLGTNTLNQRYRDDRLFWQFNRQWRDTMRKILLAAATFAALAAAMPMSANAQSNAVGGAIVGAGAGAVIGGAVTGRPEGAAVGAVIGGTTGAAVGANARERRYRERTCWVNEFGERRCRYR
jgi:uncharacterized protein YcfJ